MKTAIALTGLLLFTIFCPFGFMWCAYYLTAKAINMSEIFNSEGFWALTILWWFLGSCSFVGVATYNCPAPKSTTYATPEYMERRSKFFEENMPKRKYDDK